MNVLLPISSNNNINEENAQESVTKIQNLSAVHKSETINFSRKRKKKVNEKENEMEDPNEPEEEKEEADFRFEEEISQESLNHFSLLKSSGKLYKVKNIQSIQEFLKKEFELEGDCASFFKNYQVGEGSQGRVLKLRSRTESGSDLLVKLYKRSEEKSIRREASILSDLKRNTQGGLRISRFIKAFEDFGIIIEGGAASLLDLRNFLIDNEISLTENDLLSIHMAIMRNYEAMKSISVFHRDIKPNNIILHYDELKLEIIDYGLADYYSSSNSRWRGGAGTEGFIPPELMDREKEYTKDEMVKGDLFAIGITLLCLANLKFRPVYPHVKKDAELALKKISKFKRLCKILDALIFKGKDITEKLAKSRWPNGLRGYNSGLKGFQDRFLAYMREKKENKNQEEKKTSDVKPEMNKNEFSQVKTEIDIEREFKVAAEQFLQKGEEKKALNCYDLILKTYIIGFKDSRQSRPFYNEIRSIMDFKKPDAYSPLLFSTLGVYSYLISRPGRAKFALRLGIDICKERFDMLVLLSNYGFLCEELNCYQEDDYASFEKIYDFIKDDTNGFFENKAFIQQWLEIRKEQTENLVTIENDQETRKFEIVLSSYHLNGDLKSDRKLDFTAFVCFCKSRAVFLESLLKKNNEDLLSRIKEFCSFIKQLNQEYSTWFSFRPILKPSLEVFNLIIQFNNILQSYQGWNGSCKKVRRLKKASDHFEINQKEMHKLFSGETSENLFSLFLKNNLLIILTGFLAKSSRSCDNKCPFTLHSDYIQIKLATLLQETNQVEVLFQRSSPFGNWDSFSVLKNLFDSKLVANPSIEVDMLRKMGWPLFRFGYRVQIDPSNSTKYCFTLHHLHIVYTKDRWERNSTPLIPNSLNSLESVVLKVRDESLFEKGEKILEENLTHESLVNLSLSFDRGTDHPYYFNDYWAKQIADFIASFKMLKDLAISINDGFFTNEGIHFFNKALKELRQLKSLKLTLSFCPNIQDVSIESLVKTATKSSELKNLALKFSSCKNISLGIVDKLREKMDSPLKENAVIEVLLT